MLTVSCQVQVWVQYSSGIRGRQRHPVDEPADHNQLSGLLRMPWTFGHGLLSGRPQVRVRSRAR
jgi:hypothetical protein